MAILMIFWIIFRDTMANLGLINFKTGLYIQVDVNFGGLNQKSATISMCKIHIYIDSDSFRQIH